MKNILLTMLFLMSISISAQENEKKQENIRLICVPTINENMLPLYIIDGVPQEDRTFLEGLTAEDIESVNVLKDEAAAAVAIYGNKGRYGVILITTKREKLQHRTDSLSEPESVEARAIRALSGTIPSVRIDTTNRSSRLLGTVCNPSQESIRNAMPRYIIDGVLSEGLSLLEGLTEDDIESISVLRDSSGIFGNPPNPVILITTKNKKPQYEATVLDAGFSSFVATQPSQNFFSKTSLKTKNTLMVSEWNRRYANPVRYDAGIYEVNIDYDPSIDYGINVEYTLYMFFRFMEKENGMLLIAS